MPEIAQSCPLIANIVKDAVLGLRQFLATESPWKLMKSAFYFILKAFFVLKIFGHVEKTTWNIRLISKFMTSQPG